MENDDCLGPIDPPLYTEAMALQMTVRLTRRARGKKNPEDLPWGSPAWKEATEEFVQDIYLAMGGDPDDLDQQ
jgi:hypothetical protein